MVKKTDFLKYGIILRRMFLDKSGVLSQLDNETLKRALIQKEAELRARVPALTDREVYKKLKNYELRLREVFEKQNLKIERQSREYEEKKVKEKLDKEDKIPRYAPTAPIGWAARRTIGDQRVEAIKQGWKRGKEAAKKPVRYTSGWVLGAKEKFDDFRGRSKDFLRGKDVFGEDAGGWMFILMTVLLYMMDMLFRYNGLNIQRFLDNLYFTSIESYIGWFFNSIVLTLLIAYYVIYRPKPQEFVSWFLVAETFSLIIFMGGMGTSLIHLSFVIAFYFLYIRFAAPEGDKASANYIFFFLLAFDFFGFGLLAEFVKNPIISNRLIIPIWFYFALIYTHEKERSFWINLAIIIVILMNVFYFVGGINGLKSMSATLTDEEKQEGINFIRTGWNNVKDTFSRAIEGFRADLEAQLIYASGGYYKGKVERNKIGPLGVFIDKLKASQPRYYQLEKVIIWGTIKALSLGDGINVEVNCHKKDEEKYATTVVPDRKTKQPFTMYSKETRDFECVFGDLKTPWFSDFGIHTITVDAAFNFGTLAYLKSYFMDIERKRSMVREGLDPFKEFGITDTEPVAVYTDGPVIIGMETTSPIIEVGEGMITQPRIGVTLENKEGWEGKIRNITELVLLTPPGVTIDLKDDSYPCTVKFKEYDEDKCKTKSCVNFVQEPCKQVCDHKDGTAKDNCLKECDKNLNDCQKDCEILFEGESGDKAEGYHGYTLDTTEIKNKDMFKDIDRYRSFSCRLTVETKKDETVLGNTPLTVKYFRAKARYDYVISKDIDVQIQSEAGTAVKVSETIDTTALIPGHISAKIAGYAKGILGEDQVNLALALAWAESEHRHCCESRTDKYCKGTQEESCKEEMLITSGSSFGVMQLNRGAHCAWFYPDKICQNGVQKQEVDYSKLNCGENYWKTAPQDCKIYKESGCDGKDATNVDCSIRLSLKYLKSLYNSYSAGIPGSKITCEDEITKQKYLGYKGWFAALRAYNGMGCPDKASKEYVDTVKGYMTSKPWEKEEIKEKPSTLLKISLSSTNVEQWEQIGISLKTSGVCEDVEKYEIYRNAENGEETEITGRNCIKDINEYKALDTLNNKGKYKYTAVSLNNRGNRIEKIESEFIEVKS